MPTSRRSLASAVVDGKIYTISGVGEGATSDVVEMYDPLTDRWTEKSPCPLPRQYLTAQAINGKIYTFGGNEYSSRVHEYDPNSDTWSEKAPIPFVSERATEFGSPNSVVVENQTFIVGGDNSRTVLMYNPEEDKWSGLPFANLITPRALAATAAVNNKIYVIGGDLAQSPTYSDANEEGTIQPARTLFEDGFESGSSAWSGTNATKKAFYGIASNRSHSGNASAFFTVTPSNGTRRAYCYIDVNNLTQVYASAYVYIEKGSKLSEGQNMWFIQFVDSNRIVLASFGARGSWSGTRWAVQSGQYPNALATYGVPTPAERRWYLLEAYFTRSAMGRTIVLSVDGVEVVSLTHEIEREESVARLRFGLGFYAGHNVGSVYVDDIILDQR
jgi:hypothetical protein